LYTNKEGSWTSTNLEEIERLIAFLVYAGLVKVESEIENYWSVKTLYHGLWETEIISRFMYKALIAFLNGEETNQCFHTMSYKQQHARFWY
jgi:hypothetical protein